MNNNDILRRTRYILDLKDNQITKIFKHVGVDASEQQVNLWLKREEDQGFVALSDEALIDFLDALIIEKRGRKEDAPTARAKQELDNNLILMKLKIAFHLKAEEALAIMELAGFKISKHEFSALFRKKDHKHFRACKNQMLRKFMKGLQLKYRGRTNSHQSPSPSTSRSAPLKTIIKDEITQPKTGKLSMKKHAQKKSTVRKKNPSPDTKTSSQAADNKSIDPKPIKKQTPAASVWKTPKK